jgi:FAD/FMN-containing dehydrogenase
MHSDFPFLAPEQVLTEQHDLLNYGRDWLKDYQARPSCILLPRNEEQVIAIVRQCNEKGIALVPSGGRTGLSGGATATQGEVVISLEKMNAIKSCDASARLLTVEPGVITAKIHEAATAHNLFFPVEFTTKGSSQIGGNAATNAGGIRVVKYGMVRDWIVGLRVVTGSGELLVLNGSLMKNNTGYDFRHLFIGSEGTLGIITELTLRLTQPPRDRIRMIAACASTKKVYDLFSHLRSTALDISAFEYFSEAGLSKVLAHHPLKRPFNDIHPHYALIELERSSEQDERSFEILSPLIESEDIRDLVISSSSKQADDFLDLRERIGETLSTHYYPHKNDLSVPVAQVARFIDALHELLAMKAPDLTYVIFGHIGDGNLHLNILKPDALSICQFLERCHPLDHEVFSLVKKFHGSISAEHGVGLLKKNYLHYTRSAEEIALMKGIKQVFDPRGIMNPGKIFA